MEKMSVRKREAEKNKKEQMRERERESKRRERHTLKVWREGGKRRKHGLTPSLYNPIN